MKEYGVSWSLLENSQPMCSISVSGSDQVFGITGKNRAVVSRDDVTGELHLLVLEVEFNIIQVCDKAEQF